MFLRAFAAIFCLATLTVSPIPATAQSAAALDAAAVMDMANQKDWPDALKAAQRSGEPAVMELYEWRLLSAGQGTWTQYKAFVARNPDWPNLSNIRKAGERAMPPGVSLADIDAYLGLDGVQTGSGALRRAEALRGAGRAAEADEEIARGWRDLSLTVDEQNEFRASHGQLIAPHHEARADNLLWRGLAGEARSMKALVSPGWSTLIEARARLRGQEDGVDGAIAAVPGALAGDPGLAYERFIWRMKKNRYEDALEVISAQSASPAALGRPAEWGNRRRILVRHLYRQARFREAYNLANQNHVSDGSEDFSDAEWLAGWIALRKLNEPDRAIAHFSRFLSAVETPISYGRGYYWMGRAWEAKGDQAKAVEFYGKGAAWQTSFYGQLAAEKIGAPIDPLLHSGPSTNWSGASFAGRTVTRAAQLLSEAGDRRRAHWFLTHIASTLSSYEDLDAAAAFATALGRTDTAIRIAKIAARKGHVLAGHYYPITDLARFNQGVEPALAMAIGRQESELNPMAVSPAGARGLMQLMPATAKKVSGWVGVPYSRDRLTSDWRYNATLGQTYLSRRLDQYSGSVAMAAAAYNAGYSRVDRWIANYGDPRIGQVDWIDWIETIPFRETRNYVQRVLEGLQIYRNRIAGAPVAFRLEADALGR